MRFDTSATVNGEKGIHCDVGPGWASSTALAPCSGAAARNAGQAEASTAIDAGFTISGLDGTAMRAELRLDEAPGA